MSSKNNKDSKIEQILAISNTQIKNGKLLFQKIWYHRDQAVFVTGTQMAEFTSIISSIENEVVSF